MFLISRGLYRFLEYRSTVIEFETFGMYGLQGPFIANGSIFIGFKLFILCIISCISIVVTRLGPVAKLTLFVKFDFILDDVNFDEDVFS